MSGHVLDLSNYAFKRELGDITVIGTWLGPNHIECEPCVVLVPTYRRTLEASIAGVQQRAKPCCIALSAAYLYDEPQYLLARSMEFSQAMGFEDSMSRTHKIADIIHGGLLDLIKMPPKPVRGAYVAADATVTDGWGRQVTTEIIETI